MRPSCWRTRRRGHALAALALSALGIGCYHHQAHQPARVSAPGLPTPRQGHYQLVRGGHEIGTEQVSITSSSAWALSGVISWREPVEMRARYRLEVVNAEPRRLDADLELLAQVRTLTATVGAGYVHAGVSGVGPELRRKVAYGSGTGVDALSPALRVWMLGLLSARLLPGASVEVRTVRFEPPGLAPKVELQTLVVEAAQGDLRLVRVVRPAPAPPEALWLSPDGFVVRARTWPKGLGQPFVERRWRAAP